MSDEAPASDEERTQVVLRAGIRCFGRYTLVRKLGEGGMGVVWLARDEKLEREVALKFLPERVRQDPEALRDLRREVRRCLELAHPNIVRVNDLVEDALLAAIAMEYVAGQSLAARKAAKPNGCFDVAELAPLVAQLCSALDYAHGAAKVVHRDLKPANLLVTDAGVLKVADFGIARSLSETRTRLTMDLRATSVTLSFAGPQQLAGLKPAAADDIYSLGATLYDLLTGKPPFFRGDVFRQIETAAPEPLAQRRAELENTGAPIPAAWEETIAACLAKRAEDRPASAGAVARRLGLAPGGSEFDLDATRRFDVAKETRPAAEPATPSGPVVPPPPRAPAAGAGEAQSGAKSPPPPRPAPSRAKWFGLAAGVAIAAVLAIVFWPEKTVDGARGETGSPAAGTEAGASRVTGGGSVTVTPATGGGGVTTAPTSVREFLVRVAPPDAGARVWLDSHSEIPVPASGLLALRNVSDGEHDLTVQASGYQPYSTRVRVSGGRGEAEAKLVAVRGTLEVSARAGSAVVAIDARGREIRAGSVPASGVLLVENLLTVGRYRVTVTHSDCAPVQVNDVDLTPGRSWKIAARQTAMPGELRVFSVPEGAEIWVNGAKLGATPATLREQPSETPLAIEIRARGYRTFKETVALKPREAKMVNAGTLVAANGAIDLRLEGATGAPFEIALAKLDGQPVAAGVIRDLDLGEHVLEVTHPNYEPLTLKVVVRDGSSERVAPKLKPKPATLILEVAGPKNYVLSVNGSPVTLTNGRVKVPAQQELALEVSAVGFVSVMRKLTLPANDEFPWQVTLRAAEVTKPQAGQSWTVPELGMVLLPVAAGTFTMGSTHGVADQAPMTNVTFTKPFWLGRNEVTQREWAALMNGTPPSNFRGDDLPVEQVSWERAMEFCRRLTTRERAANRLPEGYVYTLPTEAQWEYVTKEGKRPDHDLEKVAWYKDNSRGTTHKVGTKLPNGWGFYDLHGNVCEWVFDWYAPRLPGGALRDPTGPSSGTERVIRGGAWDMIDYATEPTARNMVSPTTGLDRIGFRVALSAAK